MAVIESIKMEPENLSCMKWPNNVSLQLGNAIGENQNLNIEEK